MNQEQLAVNYYDKAMKQAKENSDPLGEIMGLNNISHIFNELHKYEKSIEYLKQACYQYEVTNWDGMPRTFPGNIIYYNMALAYVRLGNPEQARIYMNRFDLSGKDESLDPTIYFALLKAQILDLENREEEAFEILQQIDFERDDFGVPLDR